MLLNENDAVSYSLKYDVKSVKAFFCGAVGGGWGGGGGEFVPLRAMAWQNDQKKN